MVSKEKILLLVEDPVRTIRWEGPLKVAGYEVVCRQKQDYASNLYNLFQSGQQGFDLLITNILSWEPLQFDILKRKGIVARLLLVREQNTCEDIYCIHGSVGCLCRPSALLAAVKELLVNSDSINDDYQQSALSFECHNGSNKTVLTSSIEGK